MQKLVTVPHGTLPTTPDGDGPGWPDESWREYAEHSVEHDPLPPAA